jgi:cell division protein FtsQ
MSERMAARAHLWPLRHALTAVLLAALVGGGYVLLDVPLRTIEVEGPFQRVTAMQVEAALRSALTGGFLSVDLRAARDALAALPWVDDARIRRAWPAGLHVAITEQVASARWGESGLLNARGELFLTDARRVPPELPLLNGPPGTEARVAALYAAYQARLLPLGMRIAGVMLDPRGAWRVQLTNGVELRLGRDATDARMDRFLRAAAPVVSARARELEYVDLRYSNGFALGWRAGMENGDV